MTKLKERRERGRNGCAALTESGHALNRFMEQESWMLWCSCRSRALLIEARLRLELNEPIGRIQINAVSSKNLR